MVHTPERNAVAERGIALIGSILLGVRLHMPESYQNVGVPNSTWLRTESPSRVTDSLYHSSIKANLRNRSSYIMWHGKPSPSRTLPFLKLGFVKVMRTDKLQPKAPECFFSALQLITRVMCIGIYSSQEWIRYFLARHDLAPRSLTTHAGDQLKTTTP